MGGGRLKKVMREVLYRLKRSYGQPLSVHYQVSSSVNLETGAKDIGLGSVAIARAILLPADEHKAVKYDIGYLKANSNFTYGGQFTTGIRPVIIDCKDLPIDFTIRVVDTMFIVYLHKRYEIKSAEIIEGQAYYIVMQETKGSPTFEIHTVKVADHLKFGESFAGDFS